MPEPLAIRTWHLRANRPIASLWSFFDNRGELAFHGRKLGGGAEAVIRDGTPGPPQFR